MAKQTQIAVADFREITHGVTSKNQPWTMYAVIGADGKRYTTFQEKYKDAIGKTIVVEVEEKAATKVNPKTGQLYPPNLNIIEPKKQPVQSGISGQVMEKLFLKLDRIEKKIDMLTEPDEPGQSAPEVEEEILGIPF